MNRNLLIGLFALGACTSGGALSFFDSSNDEVPEKSFVVGDIDVSVKNGMTITRQLYIINDDNPQSPTYELIAKISNATDKLDSIEFTYDHNPTVAGDEGTATCTEPNCSGASADTTDHTVKMSSTKLTGTFDGSPWTIKVTGALNY